jgi:hypothetical protein
VLADCKDTENVGKRAREDMIAAEARELSDALKSRTDSRVEGAKGSWMGEIA